MFEIIVFDWFRLRNNFLNRIVFHPTDIKTNITVSDSLHGSAGGRKLGGVVMTETGQKGKFYSRKVNQR